MSVHPGVSAGADFSGESGHGRMVPQRVHLTSAVHSDFREQPAAGPRAPRTLRGESGGIASEHNDKCDSHVTWYLKACRSLMSLWS